MKLAVALAIVPIAFLVAAPAPAQDIRIAAYELRLDPDRDFFWRAHRRLHSRDARAALIAVARRLRASEREIGGIIAQPERRPTVRGHLVDYRVDPGHVLCAAFVAPTSSFAEIGACGFSADDLGVSSVSVLSPACDAHVRLDMISVRADLATACAGLPDAGAGPRAIGPPAFRLHPPVAPGDP